MLTGAMKQIILIGAGGLLGAIITGGLLLFVIYDIPVAATPSSAGQSLPQIVATVNGEAITRDMVEAELKISRLNVVDPLPPLTGKDLARAREEAVNQLVVRHLILQAAARQNFTLDKAFIEERASLLFGASGNQALNQALDRANATRADLLWWVGEILTVEAFTTQVIMAGVGPEARQQAYNTWLNQRRSKANIKIYLNGKPESLLAGVGEPAPNFTLTTLTGQTVSLADYRGRVVLVNFWATWCPSCITEMPDYEQVYRQFGQGKGQFIVLGVNFQESPRHIEPYAAGLGLTFPILLDRDGRVTERRYQVTGMPASIIIDRQGLVYYRHLGPMSAKTLAAKLAELGL